MGLGVDPKWVDVKGIRTRYFEAGTGPSVLLLPGGTIGAEAASIAETWDRNFAFLSRRYRVFVLDKLGQGYTDNPLRDEDYTKDAKLDHIIGFLRELDRKSTRLLGQSRGGFLRALLTNRVRGLLPSDTQLGRTPGRGQVC